MFIVIEGIDGSGKSTVGKALAARIDARLVEFPDRTTITGKVINRILRSAEKRDPVTMQALMTVNRLELLPYMQAADRVVAVRYTPSTLIYGGLDGLPRPWLDLISAVLPKPDLCILLDLPVRVALERKLVRGAPSELYETASKMETVCGLYLDLWRNRGDPRWVIVDAAQKPEAVLADCLSWYEAASRRTLRG